MKKVKFKAWAARDDVGGTHVFSKKPEAEVGCISGEKEFFATDGDVFESSQHLGLKPGEGPVRVWVTVERANS